MMTRTKSTYLALLAVLLSPMAANAIPLFTGVPTSVLSGSGCFGFTCGFSFTANQDLSVNSLGVFDNDADGLPGAFEVGLWNIGGTLLASVTVPGGSGGILDDGYRYAAITSVPLSTGMDYVIGVASLASMTPNLNAIAIFNPAITAGTGGRFEGGSTLQFPTNPDDRIFGGANLQFTVPEPGTLALLGLGLAGLGFRRRQR